ncbi:reverse transcriptase domain-containing protein [Tanacetum coccineum]
MATAYHPQTNGQVENTNKALKRILEKIVKDNPSIWSRKLDDALWAFRTTYNTPIGTTPYRILYGKTCHLPFEIEHCAYWALRSCNHDLKLAGEKRFMQLHELDELRLQAYKNSKLYKARTKAYHEKKLGVRKEFKAGDKVFLYNSKYKFKALKLRSKWCGPFVTPPDGAWTEYVSGGLTLLSISSTKHKERPLRVRFARRSSRDRVKDIKTQDLGDSYFFNKFIISPVFFSSDHFHRAPLEFRDSRDSHGALDLGFKVLWSKNEGTDEVLEGTAQEYESTARANLSTTEVYESTAHSLFKISVKGKLSTKEDFVSFREMITSQLQGKLWLYDEVRT